MNHYSAVSEARLETSHKDLQIIFLNVLDNFDHSILCGHRNEEEQDSCFRSKKSKLQWPHSCHNSYPATAIDAAPYDNYIKNIDWNDIERMVYFGGYVMGTARQLFDTSMIEYMLRWGADWDSDTEMKDETFRDFCHFELVIPDE